jgi:hypothetical protein
MGTIPPNCRQEIHSSLLESNGKQIAFVPGPVAGFRPPPAVTPLDYARQLMAQCGGQTLEEMQRRLPLPHGRLVCRVVEAKTGQFQQPEPQTLAALSPVERTLWHAIVLGLCNSSFYDDERPVIWTHTRLSRTVQLFAPSESFYAD